MTHDPPASRPSDLALRARRALVLVPVLMAVALLVAVVTTYFQVKAVLDTASRGQGEAWLQELRYLTRPESDWSEATLAALLSEHGAAGLRCVAAQGEAGLVVVGTCVTSAREIEHLIHSGPWRSVTTVGTLTRMVGHSPANERDRDRRPDPVQDASDPIDRDPLDRDPLDRAQADGADRPRRRPPGLGRDGGERPPRPNRGFEPFERRLSPRPDRPLRGDRPPPAPPGPRRPVPPVYLELEPLVTLELAAGARRTLAIGAGASLALVLAALAYRSMAIRAERARVENERDLRLASLGEMSAVLAHEIRNPLASMKGHAQLLAEQLEEGTRERDKADRVVHEAVRLERLTSDLLSFVRTQRIDRREIDPVTLLRDACANLDGHAIEVEVGSAPTRWSLDPERIGEVLQNLLRNATQSSTGGSPITARVARAQGGLVFTVRDRGPGIAPGQEDKIFEPFHTTRARGTGLGLAVARRIVELHGGTITAANHKDGGAIFTVVLPPTRA